MAQRAGVVGAGVLGLSIARRLHERGYEVSVFEASPELGGLASAWTVGDIRWDRHYHVTLASDLRTRAMLSWLGLEDELRWAQTRTGFYAGPEHGLRSVSSPLELLRLPSLNMLDKLRLAATLVMASRRTNGSALEAELVAEWLTKWSGARTVERFWLPLLRAKLGEEWRNTSAAFIWATARRLTAARRAGLSEERFGYVHGGYARVFDRFAEELRARDVALHPGSPVAAVTKVGKQLEVSGTWGSERFDRVVVTTAAPIAAEICHDISSVERDTLRAVRYLGVSCASLVMSHELGPYYLTYVTDPTTPFTGVIEMTAMIDRSEIGGHHLVYLPKYATADDPVFDTSPTDVVAGYLPFLASMYPSIGDTSVIASGVSSVRRVFAVPTLHYSRSMPSVSTTVPGLQVIGSANLPFSTLNVNDTLSLVDELR